MAGVQANDGEDSRDPGVPTITSRHAVATRFSTSSSSSSQLEVDTIALLPAEQDDRSDISYHSDSDLSDIISDIEPGDICSTVNIRTEAVWLLRSSFPIVLSTMSQLFLMLPILAAVGKLGTVALASMNLVSIYAGLGGIAPLSGMAMVLDSLCSQAFTAAKDRRLLGVYLQRVLVCIALILVVMYPLWWNSALIYEYLGVPADVASVTGRLLRLYFFGIAAILIYECLKSYLFAQGVRRFAVVAQLVCLPVGWFCTWLLISNEATSMGILGVPCVIIIVGVGFNIVALWYMRRIESCRQCWGGWSRAAFSDLRPVLKLGLAGSAITFFESVSLHMIDVGSLFLSAEFMAAQAILSVLMTSTWVIGTGFAIAACNRVGNLLGSRQPNRTHLAVNTALMLAVGVFLVLGTAVFCCRNVLPGVFTQDPVVAEILRTHIAWSAGAGAIQGVNMTFNGILRGQGRQALVAHIRIASFVGVGIPLAVVVVAVLKWKLAGLWLAYVASLIATLCAQFYFVAATNWEREIERCQTRISKAMLATTLESEDVADRTSTLLPLSAP
ncbi:ethionine resistance protein [Coemansia aciculifera]|uniref:Ethionine resistance protein n=1 Tax=Coemansia aciculifera TaxID=417176 RepID=A0A9W8IG29_9FUNG|nr:ethionine resistance protein [Coemansia aciculifera]